MIPNHWSRALAILVCTMTLFAADAAGGTPEDAQSLVRATIDQLRDAMQRDGAEIERNPAHAVSLVDTLVGPHVDTQLAGKLIMGKHWRSATAAQREEFIAGFRRLLLRTYAVHVRDYAVADIEYLSVSPLGEDDTRVLVRTRVQRAGKPPAEVGYRMIRSAGEWRVFDAVVNGISIVATLRATIDSEIVKYGIDGLISRLADKTVLAPAG